MNRRNIRTFAFFASMALVFACAPMAAPTVAPTLNSFSLDTIIAQTAGAAATQTAMFAPPTFTPSPLPTNTPTELPSATPTFIFILASMTPSPRPADTGGAGSSGVDYSCSIQSQLPVDNTEYAPRAVFTTRWQVRNTGNRSWDSSSIDYRYTGGDELHVNQAYDLSRTVPSGSSIDIIVDMVAPRDPGTYTTTWKLHVGRTEFCTMRLTITVK